MAGKVNVTVAIIAYYYPEFLRECIASVLAQTYRDIKVIVYDDCSPEDLKSVVDSFNDDRLSYVRNPINLGGCGNTNQAIELCDTEYICVFHGDDRMFPWMIGKLVEAMEANPGVGIAGHSKFHVWGSQIPKTPPKSGNGKLYKQNEYIKAMCQLGRFITGQSLFRKKIMDQTHMKFIPETGIAGDVYFWLEANSKGVEIFLLDLPLFEYRVEGNDNSSTRLSNAKKWSYTLKKIDDFIVGLNLGCDLKKLRTTYAMSTISYQALSLSKKENVSKEDIASLQSVRNFLKDKMDWPISDYVYEEAVAIGFLRDTITGVGQGQISLREYFHRQKELAKAGVRLPLSRKIKWFVKYVVLQRWLGIFL